MHLRRFQKAIAIFMVLIASAFAAHATTYYVSPDGNDSNPGTRSAPLKTISRGAELAQPGDTVYVLEGIYRERVSPPRGGLPGKPIVYMAEPGKKVFIKGSDVWKPQWKMQGKGIYYATPDDKMFTDDAYVDGPNPYKILLSATPQGRTGSAENSFGTISYTLGQVFVNGVMYMQVPTTDEMQQGDKTWYCDPTSGTIYIHSAGGSLADAMVELTTRRRIFAPHKRGLAYISVIGFIMEHCANQFPRNFWEKPENAQAGALGLRQGSHWLIKNNVIRYANTIGIDCGSEGADNENKNRDGRAIDPTKFAPDSSLISGNVIENNYILDNGSCGIAGYGTHNLLIKNNVIMYNNNLHFYGNKRFEQAAIKLHLTVSGLIVGNYIADNYTHGIYFDNKYPGTRVTGNVVLDNSLAGIYLEYGDYPFDKLIIDNNIFLDNKQNFLYDTDASGATFAYNLIANTKKGGARLAIYILQVTTRPRTYHNSFFNNIVLGFDNAIYSIDYPADLGGEERFDSNVYDADGSADLFKINQFSTAPAPYTPSELSNMVVQNLPPTGHNITPVEDAQDVKMPFNAWKDFWSKFTRYCDAHSILERGTTLSYNNTTLQMDVSFDPHAVKTTDFTQSEFDYFGKRIDPAESVPGPIQSLQRGTQDFNIWNGLKILPEGELP